MRSVTSQGSPPSALDRALAAASFDYNRIDGRAVEYARSPRRGIRVLVARTTQLPDDALDAILAWRLAQYLLTGFFDETVVDATSMVREPQESVHDGDLHLLAIEDDGDLHAYLTMKQPDGLHGDASFRDRERPLFPTEEMHGRAWQREIVGVDEIPVHACWEAGRFVRDQRAPDDLLGHRAALELGLTAGRLAANPHSGRRVGLILGDLDPDVALKSLRFYFVPVATFPPHVIDLPQGHPLRPRYSEHATAPFVASPGDVDNATFIRWADLDLALSRRDDEALARFLVLRHFVSVKESSLKRPRMPTEDTDYPLDALTGPSSRSASESLWRASERGQVPWRGVTLGPGEMLPTEETFWIVDGFVQAVFVGDGGHSHLAGLGPEVVFFPYETSADEPTDAVVMHAVTPVRALTTSRSSFEDFWRFRQQLFESSTSTLYVDAPFR
jgi:hypothetical protein